MRISLILAMIFCLTVGSVLAEVPNTINYQGSLTDGAGDPLTTTVSMTFTIYDDETVGSSQWSEIHPTVSVTDGLFDVVLGEGTPAVPITDVVFSGAVRWLEIEVASETITPRIQLVTVPYAFRVATVDGASGGVISGKLNIGTDNTNAGNYAFVAGESNEASQDYSAVGGGLHNEASGTASTVGGGMQSTAGGNFSTVGGGNGNTASAGYSTVGGGEGNTASSGYSIVSGGDGNTASGYIATVGGGRENSNAGDFSTIPGGYRDTITATADYSYLFGIQSTLTEDSTFMVDMPHVRFGDEATGYEIPSSDGAADQVLQTDGSGAVTWADPGLNDPGITSDHYPPGVIILTTTMQDLATTTITTPGPGYVYVIGRCWVQSYGSTASISSSFQIDETSGGSYIAPYYSAVGPTMALDATFESVNSAFADRVYYKPNAGSYTFRFEGMKDNLASTVRTGNIFITALYIPTSYGTVTTISSNPPSDADAELISVEDLDGNSSQAYKHDLRQLELKVKDAQLEALRLERELNQAKSEQGF
ncbi:hypothetical protein [Neptuniibacter sp.]|uniref:hypothetical protein n=1 Tax=Neptuniibacter sp. TaxID=1962643 RepID=UPI002617D4D8|nr:hypothetical protein [Neptuniibacter sp.]MCP4597328.1 hypothetical protein [Neptuniibacter sp.]